MTTCPMCGATIRDEQELNSRQHAIMTLARRVERLTNGAVREVLPYWDRETLRRDLAALVRMGRLDRHGQKRGTFYTLRGQR